TAEAALADGKFTISMTNAPNLEAFKDKAPVEVTSFYKDNVKSDLEGIEGVASVAEIGMVDEGIQIVLSQDKINDVNDRVASKIRAQFNSGESQIKSGISKAKKGNKQIESGKNEIKDGAGSAQSDFDAYIKQSQQEKAKEEDKKTNLEISLNDLKKQRSDLEAQLEAATTEEEREQIQAEIDAVNESITQTETAINISKQKISALQTAIDNLQSQKEAVSFELGTTYSDLAATQSTIQSTVSQLQSALADIESQKQAAIDSADMTGVITMDNVSAILNAQNFSMPAGYITDNEARILVSVGDKIEDIDELKNLILFDLDIDGLDPIRVKDIATVSTVTHDANKYAKINGENGVLLSFSKQSTYATATVSDNIAREFEKLEKENKGLEFHTLMDQGEYIHIIISSVFKDLLLGAIFAILVLLFFLRDIRPTLITAVSIPVSVIFAIALMYFTGVSINLISLSGLAIGVGMLVDNSIVVIENTYRLRSMGYSAVQAAVSGASQVAGAITASTLTTICVFVPILFIDGLTRQLFMDLALTVTYSLMASLIIALTFVPAVAKGLLVRKTGKSIISQNGRVVAWYRRTAAWALMHKKRVLLAALALLIASTGLILVKGLEFMPSMSTYQISGELTMPEGSTLEDTIRVNDKVSEEVRKIDGVESVGVILSSNTDEMYGLSAEDETDVRNTLIYVVLDKKKEKQGHKVAKVISRVCKENNCEAVTSADADMTEYLGSSGVGVTLY
ncbi:MAG: efflux RND transporter permease subunit, partial [Bacillota bacterium]